MPLAHDDWEYLRSLPELRLGLDPHWAPMAFVNAENKAAGISADYLKYIEKTLHIQLRVVPSNSWTDTIALANAGKIDIVAAVSDHNGLDSHFVFTNKYLDYPIVIVTRSDAPFVASLTDLKNLRVGVIVNSDIGSADLPFWQNIQRIYVNTAEEGLRAVENGQMYAYLGNLGVVDRLVREKYAGILRIAAPAGYSEALSFGIAPSYARLSPLIDQVLRAIPDEERELIQNSWLSTRLIFGVPARTLWLVLTPIAGITLLFIIILGAIISRMRREVKQRRWTEKELVFQTQFQTLLMNTVPIPVFVKDNEQRYVAVNPAYEQALGIRAQQVLGQTMQLAAHLGTSDMEKLNDISVNVMRTGEPAQGEIQYRSLDGVVHDAIYWIRQCRSEDNVPRAVLGAFIDVSILRTMERRELALKRQLEELTELLPAVVFQLQYEPRDGFDLLFINKYVRTLFGLSTAEQSQLPAMFMRRLSPSNGRRFLTTLLHSARVGQMVRCEFQLKDHAVGPKWVLVEASPRTNTDGSIVWNGYLSDITQAREKNAALIDATREAEEASRAKDTFLATVSHEIRTPMSGVVGILQLLDHGKLLPDDQHLVDMARNAAEILMRILNDILDFSKSQSEELKLEALPMHIRDIVDRTAGIMAPEIRRKNLDFEVTVTPEVAPCHTGDAQRLGQILLNLLSNAVKFTEAGKIRVIVDASAANDGHQELTCQVCDTGIGIGAADQEKLFSPFTQANSMTSRRYGGTGLGLAICKRLIESMGGDIALESVLGEGTTVTAKIILPIDHMKKSPEVSAAGGDVASTVAAVSQVDSNARILLVEDQPLNRELLLRQMQSLRFRACDVASNGVEALEALTKTNYLMMITDCAMPVMGGIELISLVRKQEKMSGKHMVILALTANATSQQHAECLAAGADEVLVKPINLNELAQLLQKYKIAAPAIKEFAKAGIPAEEHTELWAKLERTLVDDMNALLAHSRGGNLSAAREVAHRILGTASWFHLSDVAREAEKLEECLAKNSSPDASIYALQSAVAQVTGGN